MDNINLNKENTLPKSIISRQNRLRVLQELQTSDNLKEQALELKVFPEDCKILIIELMEALIKRYLNAIMLPKTDSNPRVTTFEPGHKNHNLNTLTAIFAPSYHSLPESVMNRIKFYINNSPGMGSFMIRNLLIAEFPQQTFLERDVINAIQYFKQDNSHSEVNDPDNDAFWLLEMLENQQKKDPRMFIAKKIHQG
ncbi:unnamed protein product [Rhizophagus irregularis]|uniref:Uncharacterized protein n=1 Tax=Rhizophagus irregularis TaxID=588596 RepID=A0A915ZF93_9GLOM|nr:unnamed protein product [Rhizophagus irregularis]CAB5373935.1 unnamed protein product [Rhizophagus irregularis]